MKKIIEYFSSKHILVNFFVVLIIIGAVYFWDITGKEDMPNMTFDFARVSAHYAGATAEEVDFHITGKIEEALEGIDGIKQIESTSSQGSCSVFISLEPGSSNRNTVVSEITDAVTGVNYPEDVETPNVREFKSNRRAVIDIAMYLKDTDILTSKQREHLQSYSDTLADRLMTLREVSEVSTSNYSEQYIKLDVNPKKLAEYSISLSEIRSILRNSNLKQPV